MIRKSILYRVGKLTKFFPAFVFIFISFIQGLANDKYKAPDFAFPQKVETRSDSLLKLYLKKGDEVMALREAMNLCIARSQTGDFNTLEINYKFIDSLSNILHSPVKNLAYLIEGELLQKEYSSNAGVYDSRNLPLDQSFPKDPTEWSGEMFKIHILQLVDSATYDLDELKPTDIKEINLLISDYSTAENLKLTIPDFIAFQGEKLLRNFSNALSLSIIPFYTQEIVNTIESKCRSKALNLLDFIIESKSNNPIVRADGVLRKSHYLSDDEREEFLKLSLRQFNGTPGEGILLYELWNRYSDSGDQYYAEIKEWIEKNPTAYGVSLLKNALSVMAQQKIEVELPKLVLPNSPIKGKTRISNLGKAYFLVYRLGRNQSTINDELILKRFNASGKPSRVIEVNNNGEVPFDYEKEIEIPGLTPGLYVVIPSKTRSLPRGWKKAGSNFNFSTIRVSDISIMTSFDTNEKESGRVYVVKGSNQEPIAGATVAYYSGDKRIPEGRLVTNKEGFVSIPNGYYRLEAIYGKSVARSESGFNYYPQYNASNVNASILTDLKVYRPGDTVQFAVVGWMQDKTSNSLIKNRKVVITLRDANYTKIGNDTLTLNIQGRANGKIMIPRGRLLGTYNLTAEFPDVPGRGIGVTDIQVEEYKLPAFNVTMQQMETVMPDVLKFSGLAATYSGMPVSDANVLVRVEYLPWRWLYMGSKGNCEYSETLFTNSSGEFELELPLANLKGTPFEKGRYSVTATVTAPSGESEKSQPLFFYLGDNFELRASVPDKIKIDSDSINLNVQVFDMAGLPVRKEVEYKIFNKEYPSLSINGVFISPNLALASAPLLSGEYKMEFSLKGEDKWTSTECVIWREKDVKVPSVTSLWIPQTEYSYAPNERSISVSFGSYYEDGWILFILSDGEKTLESKWISPSDNLIRETIEIPSGEPTLFISLSGMHDFKSETGGIKIVSKKSLEKMNVSSSSFRDKISAGDNEEWTFQFKVESQPAPFTNVMAVMSDKALNAIRDFKWNLNIARPLVYPKVHINPQRVWNTNSYKNFTSIFQYKPLAPILPGWETYGYSWLPGSMIMHAPLMYKSMATSRNAMVDSMVESVMADSEEEVASETAAGINTNKEEGEEMRPVEMPLAFFKPDLRSDENGLINLKFTVPNFNTTWQLQVLGYDNSLLNASIVLDAVASKPVMVKSNLPLYLRTGDKAQISATLYNNSGEPLPVGGKIEILNSITGESLVSKDFPEIFLPASGNRVISIKFDTPEDIPFLTVKAYAYGRNHSDGEQDIIQILPSSTPVIEAVTFYGKSNEKNIELRLPKLNKNANITLKYCDNPLWEVLLSLPSLRENSNNTSLSLANWLYATILSLDLVNSNQEFSNGLRNIFAANDSALSASNLQKDRNLKIVSLQATPWINTASQETDRIRSLNQYLDGENVERLIEAKVDALLKMQNSDGGFSWCPEMKSSPYITSQIIGVMGYLNQKGLLNSSLQSMTGKAVKYYDNWILENRKKHDEINVFTVMNYLYSRNMTGYSLSKEMKELEKECLDSIQSQWRHWDVSNKAKGALVLLSGSKTPASKYETVLTIAASLKEFIMRRNTLNEEALMLELFEKLEPESESVEKIRESMFLKKETEDWGAQYNSIGVIYPLVSTTSQVKITGNEPKIYLGERELSLPEVQTLTGNFTINLNAKEASEKTLVIRKEPGLPVWGGVISQLIKPIKNVKDVRVENLSIMKRVFKEDSKGNVKEVTSFQKGDKITVVLNVMCTKDMDYVVIKDSRAACLQPEDNTSGMVNIDGIYAYREIGGDKTSYFIEHLPVGNYVISYDCFADREGDYALGMAEIQCLYSPSQVSHSAGSVIKVKN